MNDQSQKTYYEIIKEVGILLEEGGQVHGIDREMIYSIQSDWIENLKILQSVPVANITDKFEFNDHNNMKGEDSLSEEDKLDRLERQIGVYMVCTFLKVTKTKTKWKCSFKNGFINFGNHDIPYSTATGELLQW